MNFFENQESCTFVLCSCGRRRRFLKINFFDTRKMEASSFDITPTNTSLDENKSPSILILDKVSEFPNGRFESLEGSGIRMWVSDRSFNGSKM